MEPCQTCMYETWTDEHLEQEVQWRGFNRSDNRDDYLHVLKTDDDQRKEKYRAWNDDTLRREINKRGLESKGDREYLLECLVEDDRKRYAGYRKYNELDELIKQRGLAVEGGRRDMIERLIEDDIKRESEYTSWSNQQLNDEIERLELGKAYGRRGMIKKLVAHQIKTVSKKSQKENTDSGIETGDEPDGKRGHEDEVTRTEREVETCSSKRNREELVVEDSEFVTATDKAHEVYSEKLANVSSTYQNQEEKYPLAKVDKIQDYLLLEELGKGAFGTVHKAKKKCDTSDALLAIKIIDKKVYKNEKASSYEKKVAMYKLEPHPNVIRIHDFFSNAEDTFDYLVMDYCPDGDLNDYVVKMNPSLIQKIGFMIDMASGVEFLHKNKVIHRDLKPQNILMSRDQGKTICKITDFGVSKIEEGTGVYFSTVVGTRLFIAPEVMSGGYTFSADVFSLGVVYMAVYLQNKYEAKEGTFLLPTVTIGQKTIQVNSLYISHRDEQPAIISSHIGESKTLADLVTSMLECKPEKRPKMDSALITRLEKAREEIAGTEAHTDKSNMPETPRFTRENTKPPHVETTSESFHTAWEQPDSSLLKPSPDDEDRTLVKSDLDGDTLMPEEKSSVTPTGESKEASLPQVQSNNDEDEDRKKRFRKSMMTFKHADKTGNI